MKVLAVIDMQNDFIDGALGTEEAVVIVPRVKEKIELARKSGDLVVFTRDTHSQNYLQTQEGVRLPVAHCIKDSDGWQISSRLDVSDSTVFDKPCFGSEELANYLKNRGDITEIELCGLCTDICVISNALLLKAALCEVPITVDASACAGVTPESHRNALKAMQMCQIDIINETAESHGKRSNYFGRIFNRFFQRFRKK